MEPKRKNTSKHVQVCHFAIFFLRHQINLSFRVKEESHSQMNYTQEVGMDIKGRSDIVISTGWHRKDSITQSSYKQ